MTLKRVYTLHDPAMKMDWGSLPEGYCRYYVDAATNCVCDLALRHLGALAIGRAHAVVIILVAILGV